MKEKDVYVGEKSLRALVDKWLAPTPAMPARVSQFGRTSLHQRRYACVEAFRPTGSVVIIFFRHDDGSWCVFPPASKRPVMTAY
ncbi:hypothetical protein SAMN05446635_6828 [Burkholderia sp. OK233]|nr:hypothetical protein SAMN05446635_6828 [Burkholderia sp. OK233]